MKHVIKNNRQNEDGQYVSRNSPHPAFAFLFLFLAGSVIFKYGLYISKDLKINGDEVQSKNLIKNQPKTQPKIQPKTQSNTQPKTQSKIQSKNQTNTQAVKTIHTPENVPLATSDHTIKFERIAGSWKNCSETRTRLTLAQIDKQRILNFVPTIKQMSQGVDKCGRAIKINAAQKNNHFMLCNPKSEKPCCRSMFSKTRAKCVGTEQCSDKHNGVKYDDLNYYKEADACEWFASKKIDNKTENIKIPDFDKDSVLEKLKNKRILIVGDSHSRGMFLTLFALLTGSTLENILEKPIFENSTYYQLLYSPRLSTLRAKIGNKISPFKTEHFTISWFSFYDEPSSKAFVSSITEKQVNSESKNIFDGYKNVEIIVEQGQHQRYYFEGTLKFMKVIDAGLNESIKINDISLVKKTFVTPPRASIFKPINFRPFQPDIMLPKFERIMSKKMQAIGWNILRLSDLTRNLHSMDGVHYGFNVYKTFWNYYFRRE